MRRRSVFVWTAVVGGAFFLGGAGEPRISKGKRGGSVRPEVVSARPVSNLLAPTAAAFGFTPQFRLGYTVGDQWEPSIAADRFSNVYVLYPQYLGVPGCASCPSPTMILQVSRDGGQSWGEPRTIASPGTGQWDAQIAVDPEDGRTLYAAWLQNGKSDTVVAKSADFGETWSVVVADRTNAGTDKPILAVRGGHVYVGFNHANKVWVAGSHDAGSTFTATNVNANGKLGWSLAGGGTVTPDGTVLFGWAGYERNGGGKGRVNLYVSRSIDGGVTWTNGIVDVSGAPPDCSEYRCGWAYLGAQIALAADEGGSVYALWNSGKVDRGPERVFFARSADSGLTWSLPVDVSSAGQGAQHAFPALAAGEPGDVRIAWMDSRTVGFWNTYYRSSSDGGATWSRETDLATFVPGYSYIKPEGFRFPFGDYFEMAIDPDGLTHAVWGEGFDYQSPGSIWYARGR